MKVKYFFKEGCKNVWSNGIMSAASILVMICCMILTGGALLMSVNLNNALKSIENQNSITVFLNDNIRSQSKIAEVKNKILQNSNIISCEYYSSEEATDKYHDVLGDNLYEIIKEDQNTFPEAFHVTMKDLSMYNKTVSALSSIEEVQSVSDRSETAGKLSNLSRLISQGGMWIVLALGIVSLFIISNTIKITMHNRRFEISIMKSVGATNGFIKAPFIIEGAIIGVVAAVFSTFMLNLVYEKLLGVINGIMPFSFIGFSSIFWKVFGSFICVGIAFGVVGSLISLQRYLNKEGGDVVAW